VRKGGVGREASLDGDGTGEGSSPGEERRRGESESRGRSGRSSVAPPSRRSFLLLSTRRTWKTRGRVEHLRLDEDRGRMDDRWRPHVALLKPTHRTSRRRLAATPSLFWSTLPATPIDPETRSLGQADARRVMPSLAQRALDEAASFRS
jgi:hypothetical protein